MSLDHAVSLFSASISFVGLLFLAFQIKDNTRQRESDSLVKIYDINRELLSLGFSHPQLFGVLSDKQIDPVLERYYLQLWFNQYSQVHSYLKRSLFKGDLRESLERDLSDFMTMKNVQKHWHKHAEFYPASFQAYVNEVIKKAEPPPSAAAQVK